jgi:hypothetical protein
LTNKFVTLVEQINSKRCCPVCNGEMVSGCRCKLNDGKCENGHKSFICPKCEVRVETVGEYNGHPTTKNCKVCSENKTAVRILSSMKIDAEKR